MIEIRVGDCRDLIGTDPFDSIVCDPPYGLSFMGKGWDHGVPGVDFWSKMIDAAKPGCHLLAFGGTRTYHRLACAIEDAGWEVRDCIMWVYGGGFPKSHDVSKAIDKAAGAEREIVGSKLGQPGYSLTDGKGGLYGSGFGANGTGEGECRITAPATDAAKQWQGWGTALKPAWEPIIVARKPLSGTVAENVLKHGTGGINVDGCRVGAETIQTNRYTPGRDMTSFHGSQAGNEYVSSTHSGRWPANLIHDGSGEVVGLMPKDAARFFKSCPPDATCHLCCLPYAEACNTMQAWKNRLVSIAKKRGWTFQATSEFIARVSAIGPASERIVPHVKSAENLCDSCAISIAVGLVATKTSAFSSEELQATLASTGSYSDSILIPSLASFAELWASIDTIPTTNSLSLLFGSVRDAIASSTRRDTKEKAEPRCAPSRFAYVPKASKADRDEGCEGLEAIHRANGNKWTDQDYRVANGERPPSAESGPRRNHHPTVKPTALMRYLCRLVTPPGGVVLDPFMGSGSTGKAAVLEGFGFVGYELSQEYADIAAARIAAATPGLPL